jgi:hypothetical protein
MVTTVHHMKLADTMGANLVNMAREMAYETKNFNAAMVFLAASGINDYDICHKILSGSLTLTIGEDEEGHQVFVTKEDTWKPPVPKISESKMRAEVIEFCRFVMNGSWNAGRVPAFKRLFSENEQALSSARASQLRELVDIDVKIAYKHMMSLRDEIMANTIQKANEFNKSDYDIVELPGDVKPPIKYADEIEKTFRGKKTFNFVYKGHEYTYNDSARNQSECPHCGASNGDIRLIDPIRDGDDFAFMGYKRLNEDTYAVCFHCQNCFNYLFYHMDSITVNQNCDEFSMLSQYKDD